MTEIEKALKYFDGYGSPYDDLLTHLLKKAIPMQVNDEKTNVKALDVETQEVVTFTDCAPCPKCTKWLIKTNNYCPHCGQRIKG